MKPMKWVSGLVHDDKGLRLRDDFRGLPGMWCIHTSFHARS
jgi:hypothetical protein